MSKQSRGKKHVCQSGGLIGRVSKHDRYHIELKYRYQLQEDMKKRSYVCDAFFFIPHHLGVNATSYKAEDLFADSQVYMRLEALPVPLSVLLDAEARANPLRVIRKFIGQAAGLRDQDKKLICHEAKLFGATMAAAARNEIIILRDDTPEEQVLDESEWKRRAAVLVQELSDIADQFRTVRTALKHPDLDDTVKKTLSVVDEYISFETEILLARVMTLSREREHDQGYQPLWDAISERIVSERQRREHHDANWAEHMKSAKSAKNNIDVEEAWLEFAFFKKVVSSCLFLDSSESHLSKTLSEIMMGLAAALAMVFALTVAVVSTYKYPINSMPWLVIATVAYIFKDRIKEYLRHKGASVIQPFLSDRKSFLSTPLGKKHFGVVTENLSFQSSEQLDPEILRTRMANGWASANLMPGSENIMRFSKKVSFTNADVTKIHGQIRNAVSIMRIDVRRILARMDDPFRIVNLVDTGNKNVRKAKIPRVYHVPLVMRYIDISEEGQTVRYHGLRLILDRRGIRRIEEMDITDSTDKNATRDITQETYIPEESNIEDTDSTE